MIVKYFLNEHDLREAISIAYGANFEDVCIIAIPEENEKFRQVLPKDTYATIITDKPLPIYKVKE